MTSTQQAIVVRQAFTTAVLSRAPNEGPASCLQCRGHQCHSRRPRCFLPTSPRCRRIRRIRRCTRCRRTSKIRFLRAGQDLLRTSWSDDSKALLVGGGCSPLVYALTQLASQPLPGSDPVSTAMVHMTSGASALRLDEVCVTSAAGKNEWMPNDSAVDHVRG
jgi:hypothetical protein